MPPKVVYKGERSDFVENNRIIEMLFARSEEAIRNIQSKFGKYCYTIAYNVLNSDADAKECVNDTYMQVWQSIPPNRPADLSAYIGCITRNLSRNRLKRDLSQKRRSNTDIVLDELSEIISEETADFTDSVFIKDAINSFLAKLSSRDRRIFVQRYWYMYSTREIAAGIGKDENFVNVRLFRLRESLKKHLEGEGISL